MTSNTSSPKVYSYRRFSSGRQALGQSLQRQIDDATAWCEENGYTLDESLSIQDLGVSAYKGDNVSKGKLSGFIAAIQAGKVPKGSILIVESLDRLSRLALPEAMGLLTEIVRADVRVISLVDNTEWNQETIEDTMAFMMSVILFSRAHEESRTKSRRVSKAFQSKRTKGLPVVSKMHGGGWVKPKNDFSGWELVPEKAKSVQRVFELAADGKGGVSIARIANEEGLEVPWRPRTTSRKGWEHTAISRLLRDRRVLGEWQPKRIVNRLLVDDGDPVINYFPRVIDDNLWHRTQAALNGRKGPTRTRGAHSDIFSGVFFCSCGKRMEKKAKSERGQAMYYCQGRKEGLSDCRSIPERAVVETFFTHLSKYKGQHFRDNKVVERIREQIHIAEAKEKDALERIERIADFIEDGSKSPTLSTRLAAAESDLEQAKKELAEHRHKLANIPKLGAAFSKNIAANAIAAVEDKAASDARFQFSKMIRSVCIHMKMLTNGLLIELEGQQGVWFRFDEKYLRRAKRRDAGMSREEIAIKTKST